jgi:hypothetical protein
MMTPIVNVALTTEEFRGKTIEDISSGFVVGRGGGRYLEFRFTDGTKAHITILASEVFAADGTPQKQESHGADLAGATESEIQLELSLLASEK